MAARAAPLGISTLGTPVGTACAQSVMLVDIVSDYHPKKWL